jgi:hypothetical protein
MVAAIRIVPRPMRRPSEEVITSRYSSSAKSRTVRAPHNAAIKQSAADSIVNRLANHARIITLGQIDMRRHRNEQLVHKWPTGSVQPRRVAGAFPAHFSGLIRSMPDP